jgi:hypothetical protein
MKFSFVPFGINVALSSHCEGRGAPPEDPAERYSRKIHPKERAIWSKDRWSQRAALRKLKVGVSIATIRP